MPHSLTESEVKQRLARGNLSLLSKYHNSHGQVRVRCRSCGHRWQTQADCVLNGHGCPRCANLRRGRRLTAAGVTQRLRKVGVTLRGKYNGANRQLAVRCTNCGHEWTVMAWSLLRGRGCPQCYRTKRRLAVAEVRRRLARAGLQLVGTYRSSHAYITIRCLTCGWQWPAHAGRLSKGCGCPRCEDAGRVVPVAEVRARLAKVGVELLGQYRNANHRVKARCCRCGHKWRPKAASLFNGTSCPRCHCRGGKKEHEVRCTIERITGWKFPKVHPAWLKGRSLGSPHLDGYNQRHQVAFEYQGFQHYHPVEKWGGAKALLINRRRDVRKRVSCQRHGIRLICIPYWKRDVESFIRSKLAGVTKE